MNAQKLRKMLKTSQNTQNKRHYSFAQKLQEIGIFEGDRIEIGYLEPISPLIHKARSCAQKLQEIHVFG